jgi:hypothetical protein
VPAEVAMIAIPDDKALTGLGRHELLVLVRQLDMERTRTVLQTERLLAAAKKVFTERLTLEVTDELRAAVDAYEEKKET